jgi:DnaJ domain
MTLFTWFLTHYLQLALRTHPDKNQNNPDATVQFQQISSAYNVLLKHLDTSTPPPIPDGFSPFHHYHSYSHSHSRTHSGAHQYDEDDEDDEDGSDSEDYYDTEEEYYYDEEEEEENLDFFMYVL